MCLKAYVRQTERCTSDGDIRVIKWPLTEMFVNCDTC